MLTALNRTVSAAAAVALVATLYLGLRIASAQDAAHMAPPAQDSLTQWVDLNRIADFRYVDDTSIEVTDESGKRYHMQFTEPCPGLKYAKDFSLVTDSYRNLDRFTAIDLQGHICTFKDFANKP